MVEVRGHIFDMQRFCTHDGPGIRTTIFLKGCPLHCAWCSNPESQSARPQLMFHDNLCRNCGRCARVCPTKAAQFDGRTMLFMREKCVDCGACAKVCPFEARVYTGREVTVDEVVEFARQDWRYYMQSDGGITCSGGEALAQPEFLYELFRRLNGELGYHTCLDTTAYAPWEHIGRVLPYTRLVLLDVKHMNAERHKALTGVDNALILENAVRLSKADCPVLIRIPLIPGFNDTPENIAETADFLADCRFRTVEIMPYHTFGQSKYAALGRDYATIPGTPDVNGMVDGLRKRHLTVTVHGAVND